MKRVDSALSREELIKLLQRQDQLLREELGVDYALTGQAEVSAEQFEQLACFVELLAKWTERVDLVAPAPLSTLVERHIVDSMAAYYVMASKLEIHASWSLLDVGSGAGLPGLVIAILEPKRQVFLSEPREKRAIFLKEARRILGLEQVQVLRARVEELEIPGNAEVGLMTARALGKEALFVRSAASILSPGGYALMLVGPSWEGEEVLCAKLQGLEFFEKYPYRLLSAESERCLAVWRKTGA